MSMKNSNNTIWNRTSDLPICSTTTDLTVLISNFRIVLNVLIFLLGDSPASEFCADVSEHCDSSIFIGRLNKTPHVKIEQTESSETSAQKIQTPENHPKERIEQILYSPTELTFFYFGTNNLTIYSR